MRFLSFNVTITITLNKESAMSNTIIENAVISCIKQNDNPTLLKLIEHFSSDFSLKTDNFCETVKSALRNKTLNSDTLATLANNGLKVDKFVVREAIKGDNAELLAVLYSNNSQLFHNSFNIKDLQASGRFDSRKPSCVTLYALLELKLNSVKFLLSKGISFTKDDLTFENVIGLMNLHKHLNIDELLAIVFKVCKFDEADIENLFSDKSEDDVAEYLANLFFTLRESNLFLALNESVFKKYVHHQYTQTLAFYNGRYNLLAHIHAVGGKIDIYKNISDYPYVGISESEIKYGNMDICKYIKVPELLDFTLDSIFFKPELNYSTSLLQFAIHDINKDALDKIMAKLINQASQCLEDNSNSFFASDIINALINSEPNELLVHAIESLTTSFKVEELLNVYALKIPKNNEHEGSTTQSLEMVLQYLLPQCSESTYLDTINHLTRLDLNGRAYRLEFAKTLHALSSLNDANPYNYVLRKTNFRDRTIPQIIASARKSLSSSDQEKYNTFIYCMALADDSTLADLFNSFSNKIGDNTALIRDVMYVINETPISLLTKLSGSISQKAKSMLLSLQ